jgi:hypothetical protein
MKVVLIPREQRMSEEDRTGREKVPVADLIAEDWILTDDEDSGDPVQLLWRTGHRSPNGEFGWSFKTSAGVRHFDQDAWVYRVTGTRQAASVDTNTVDDAQRRDVVSTVARTEVLVAVPEVTRQTEAVAVARAATIQRQLTAERAMVHAIIRGIIVALPIAIAVLLGMMAVALSDKQPWYAWVGLGIVLGVYAAGFFGAIAGVMLSAHLIDDADEAAVHEPDRRSNDEPFGPDSTT